MTRYIHKWCAKEKVTGIFLIIGGYFTWLSARAHGRFHAGLGDECCGPSRFPPWRPTCYALSQRIELVQARKDACNLSCLAHSAVMPTPLRPLQGRLYGDDYRWCRPRRAQPPATVLTSLQLAKTDFRIERRKGDRHLFIFADYFTRSSARTHGLFRFRLRSAACYALVCSIAPAGANCICVAIPVVGTTG
jgi:hypothetical protein